MKKPKSFEEGISRLEELLEKLSNENTPLDEAVKLYRETADLMQFCTDTLKKAKLQMEEIDLKLSETQE